MTDSYQAIYDAVRSKINGGDIVHSVSEVAHRALDISHAVEMVRNEFMATAYAQRRPSVLFRPTLSLDGTHWCALYGQNLQDGVAGFGLTPEQAMEDFDREWNKNREGVKSD